MPDLLTYEYDHIQKLTQKEIGNALTMYSPFVSYRTRVPRVFFYIIELKNKNIRVSDVTL